MSKQLIDRQEQGKLIAGMRGSVKRINETSYKVNSQSSNNSYNVNATEIGWNCSCPDHIYRGVKCKHIYAVEISFAIRKEVEIRKIEPVQINSCIFCSSFNIVKDGLRHNKYGDLQKFNCRDCNRYFTINLGFERMKAIHKLLHLHCSYISQVNHLEMLQKFLKL